MFHDKQATQGQQIQRQRGTVGSASDS